MSDLVWFNTEVLDDDITVIYATRERDEGSKAGDYGAQCYVRTVKSAVSAVRLMATALTHHRSEFRRAQLEDARRVTLTDLRRITADNEPANEDPIFACDERDKDTVIYGSAAINGKHYGAQMTVTAPAEAVAVVQQMAHNFSERRCQP